MLESVEFQMRAIRQYGNIVVNIEGDCGYAPVEW